MQDQKGWWYRAALSLTLAIVAVAYADVLDFGHLPSFDDDLYLYDRPVMRQGWWQVSWWQRLLTPELGYPVPIPTILYSMSHWFFGDASPKYLHWLNLALHLANVTLVGCITRSWSDDRRLAVLVAAVWGLHPLCVESVGWLTDLKILVFATASLASIYAAERMPLRTSGRQRVIDGWDVSLTGCFLVGLGARPEALMIPGFVVVVAWRRADFWVALQRVKVLAAVTVVAACVYVPLAVLGQSKVVEGLPKDASSPKRLFVRVCRALEISARNTVAPFDLQPGYFRRSNPKWSHGLPGFGVLVGVVAAMYGAIRLRHRGVVAAFCIALLAYLPYSQIKALPRLTADSYMYVPLVGVVLAVGLAGKEAFEWLKTKESVRVSRIRPAIWALIGVWLATMTWVTTQQVDRWRSTQALWIPHAVKSSVNWKPYSYIGEAYVDAGEFAMAASTYDHGLRAFRLHRHYPVPMFQAFEQAGAPKKAWELVLEAVRRQPSLDPGHYMELLRLLGTYRWANVEDVPIGKLNEAVDVYIQTPAFVRAGGLRRRLMLIFASSKHPTLSSRLIEWELQHVDVPSCAVWISLGRAGKSIDTGEAIPPEPARCEGVTAPQLKSSQKEDELH